MGRTTEITGPSSAFARLRAQILPARAWRGRYTPRMPTHTGPTTTTDRPPPDPIPDEPIYRTDHTYTDRAGKAVYIASKYAPILAGRVLDVGCDQRQLAAHLPATARYTGIDLAPPADVVLDLDAHDLPCADASFDTVVCTDVLEHLDRLHAVFDELCRVSSDRVIVSLPNCVRNLLLTVFQGSGGQLKYYGLPTEAPKDRHRWFFGYEDAARFVAARGRANGFIPEQIEPEDSGCYYWLGRDGRDVLDHPNITGGTMWAVLRRKGER